MSERRPDNFILLIKMMLERRLSEILVGAAGRIERFDEAKMLADVQPLISRAQPDGSSKDFPLLKNIRVNAVGCGDYIDRPPYKKGDLVWVGFSTFSIARPLKGKKAETDTAFGLQDAFVVGPLMPEGFTLPPAMAGLTGFLRGHKDGGAIQQMLPDKVVFHFGTKKTTIDVNGVSTDGKLEADEDVTSNKASVPLTLRTVGHSTVFGPTLGKIPGGEA